MYLRSVFKSPGFLFKPLIICGYRLLFRLFLGPEISTTAVSSVSDLDTGDYARPLQFHSPPRIGFVVSFRATEKKDQSDHFSYPNNSAVCPVLLKCQYMLFGAICVQYIVQYFLLFLKISQSTCIHT